MSTRTLTSVVAFTLVFCVQSLAANRPVVILTTTMGDIHIELNNSSAPITSANFLRYVNEGFFDGEDGLGATTFHRVIDGFVIQGGGHLADMTEKETHEPIFNECHNGLHNYRGTIAMARTSEPHTATSQFYINHVDNLGLDPSNPEAWGYAVFGRVVQGMDVVDAIAVVEPHSVGEYNDVPVVPIVITDAATTIRYVDENATGPLSNGQTWCGAYLHLQDALAEAAAAGGDITEIRVADGTYMPDRSTASPTGTGDRTATFQLLNGVTLAGGYAGCGDGGDERDIALYETILSGDLAGDDGPDFANNAENSLHVVTGSGTDDTAVLGGLTIIAGSADATFPDNRGGGMSTNGGSPTVTSCTFSANSAVEGGGGMFNQNNSSPTVTNCTFSRNEAGGMYNLFSNPTVIGCTFRGNSISNKGGGMWNSSTSSPIVTDCTFTGNSANAGGGMYNLATSSPAVTNCTFSGNSASNIGGGMYNATSSSPIVTNCILWNNIDDGGMDESAQIHDDGGSASVVNHSDVQGGWTGAGGVGNINADPLFIDADGADNVIGTEDDNVRLQNGSPCIDAGDNAAIPTGVTTDFDGGPRRCDDPDTTDTGSGTAPIVDMGAHEFCDCNENDIDDAQDIEDCAGDSACDDCNENGIPDECDIADESSTDINSSGIPDECELPLFPPAPEPGGPACTQDSDCVGIWQGAVCVSNLCYAPKNRYVSIDPTTNGNTPVALEVTLTSMRRCSGDDRRACAWKCDGAYPLQYCTGPGDADCPTGHPCLLDGCPNVCDLDHDRQCTTDAMCGSDGPCISTLPCDEHADVGAITRWVDEPTESICRPLSDCHACSISGANCNPELPSVCNDGVDGACLPTMWFAHLAATPVYRVWTEGIVHIEDCEIVPAAEYEIRATVDEFHFSDALGTGTIRKPNLQYGDCVGPATGSLPTFPPPDGFIGITDIQAYLIANQGWSSAPHTTWVDLHGLQGGKICELPDIGCIIPQQILSVSDLATIKFAFIGRPYSATPGQMDPGDCP